jgi:hypothetical protein
MSHPLPSHMAGNSRSPVDSNDPSLYVIFASGNVAVPGQHILCQPTAPLTVTLPLSPFDGAIVWVKWETGGPLINPVTVATQGSDTFVSGSVTFDFTVVSEWRKFRYIAATGIWHDIGGVVPKHLAPIAVTGNLNDAIGDVNYSQAYDGMPVFVTWDGTTLKSTAGATLAARPGGANANIRLVVEGGPASTPPAAFTVPGDMYYPTGP